MKRIILIITILASVCTVHAQNAKYGVGNIHFNESKSRSLTAGEIQKAVSDLWRGLPDHGINGYTRQSLTRTFFALVAEGFAVPTDDPGGIGSGEVMWYWYNYQDSGENDHISKIKVISQTSDKIVTKATYIYMNEPEEHTMVLVKEDDQWKIDDFDSKRSEIQNFINYSRQQFSGGLHKRMMQEPEYAQILSAAERRRYIDEVEYYLDRYARRQQDRTVARDETVTYTRTNLADILEKVVDQYPEDVKLFENPVFRERLIALMGETRFNIMVQNFQYTYPIEKGRSKYLIMGCKRNKCGITDFEIQYNPDSNNLCVKYNVDGNTEEFMDVDVKVNWHEYIDE